MAEAIALAKELNNTSALAAALFHGGILWHLERDPTVLERLASELIELSLHQNFAVWLAGGTVLRGWARSASGDTTQGISCIEDGIGAHKATGSILNMSYALALKAESLHIADRTPEALLARKEADSLVESSGERWWNAELHRLRGVFLAAISADEAHIEASFCAAIKTAKEQKSTSLAKRAEATYAEYRKQKANASPGRGLRLPLC